MAEDQLTSALVWILHREAPRTANATRESINLIRRITEEFGEPFGDRHADVVARVFSAEPADLLRAFRIMRRNTDELTIKNARKVIVRAKALRLLQSRCPAAADRRLAALARASGDEVAMTLLAEAARRVGNERRR